MKQIDFEHGKITDNILRASIPMLVAEVLSLLYNIVDRIYIARIPDVGTTALGAVGLCFPIITIILAFSNLFGSGGAPLFSIERGRKDTKEASMIMNTSFFLICVCALLLMAVGMIFAKPILLLFGSSENGLIYAYPYLMIYLIGTFPSMVSTGMNPFINAQGYATTGMFSVAIGAIANLILDPVFIFVFGLGIRGAAIATVLSQILSAAFVLYFLRKKTELKVRLLSEEEIRDCGRRAKNIISLGTAGFIMQLTNSLVTICCNNVLSVTGGDLYISVMTIVSSIRQIIDTPIHAITEGSSPVISYNYGARRPKRVFQSWLTMSVMLNKNKKSQKAEGGKGRNFSASAFSNEGALICSGERTYGTEETGKNDKKTEAAPASPQNVSDGSSGGADLRRHLQRHPPCGKNGK